jgi:hypothetical protein
MAGDRELRFQAARAVAKALGDARTRGVFQSNGYKDEQQIIVALDGDTVQAVFNRIQKYDPPVIVAIYWPETENLEFTGLEPASQPADYAPDRDDVGGTSTIGMLWQHVDRQSNGLYKFKLNWGSAPTVKIERFDHVPA